MPVSITGEAREFGTGRHIQLNAGNVMAIGILSLLWYGFANWSSQWLARTEIPAVSQLAIAMQNYLHGPSMAA